MATAVGMDTGRRYQHHTGTCAGGEHLWSMPIVNERPSPWPVQQCFRPLYHPPPLIPTVHNAYFQKNITAIHTLSSYGFDSHAASELARDILLHDIQFFRGVRTWG